jgi:hypothetical protein
LNYRVERVEVCGPYSLELEFKDGTHKRVNLRSFLDGPVFEPLKDPKYFRRVKLDRVAGTVVWPNGADVAPERLYSMRAERRPAASRTARRDPKRSDKRSR